jgi:hypothetical protein
MAAARCVFKFLLVVLSNKPLELGMQNWHIHLTYKFRVNNVLCVDSYKYGGGGTFEVTFDKFHIVRICTFESYARNGSLISVIFTS